MSSQEMSLILSRVGAYYILTNTTALPLQLQHQQRSHSTCSLRKWCSKIKGTHMKHTSLWFFRHSPVCCKYK